MLLKIYSKNTNRQDIIKVADRLSAGQIIILPTDTLYAFACSIDSKKSAESIARLKGFSLKQARYSLLFDSLSRMSDFVRPMSRDLFRLVKDCLPGPFTFIMDANSNVPRAFLNPNKTIGVRVPDNPILAAVIQALDRPLIATSVRKLDNSLDAEYFTDPELINEQFSSFVDLVVDGGIGVDQPSTVVDCSNDSLSLIRQGIGILPFDIDQN